MTASTTSSRGAFGHRAKMLILGAMLACLGVFAFSGPAKAAPFSTDITNGQINLGFAFKGAEIMPAPATLQTEDPPAPPTALPDLWDLRDTTNVSNPLSALPVGCASPALLNITGPTWTPVGANPLPACAGNPSKGTVSGDLTGNDVTVVSTPQPTTNGGLGAVPGPAPPAAPTSWGLPSEFRFPIMVVPNPLDNSPVPITLAATDDITGTFDSATGDLSLTGPIEARVLVGLATNPLGKYCAVPLEGLTLSTTSNADFPGVPYTSGIGGQGALTGTYNITQNSTSVGGADCGTVDQVSKGAGSIWLSNGIAEPPVCPENTTGIPPNCEPIPCPAGYTGNEPDCVKLKAKIGKVTVKGPKKAKKGKKVTFKVKVKNTGNTTANTVKVKASGKGASGKGKTGKINAGKAKTIKVKVKLKKTGKIKVKFNVTSKNAGKKTVKTTVKVKK